MARRLPTPWKRYKKDPKTSKNIKDVQGREIFDWYVTLNLGGGKRSQVFLAPMDTPEEKVKDYLLLAINEANIQKPGVKAGFLAIMQAYLDHVQAHQKAKTYKIRSGYLYSFRDYLEATGLLSVAAEDLQPFHVTRWLGLHPAWGQNTRRMAILSIRTCLNWAYKEGYLKMKLLETVDVPPEVNRGQEVVLSPEQRQLLIEHCTGDCQKYVLIALYASGCRPGEICDLQAENVDLDQNPPVWQVRGKATKANPTGIRLVALPPILVTITKKLLELHPTGPLFRNSSGTAWKPGLIDAFVYRVRRRVLKKGHKLPAKVIPYGMRHTFATDLIKGGARDYDVAKLMGHASTKMVHGVYAKHDVSTASRALEHLRCPEGDLRALEAPQKVRKAPSVKKPASEGGDGPR
jgi:integrase